MIDKYLRNDIQSPPKSKEPKKNGVDLEDLEQLDDEYNRYIKNGDNESLDMDLDNVCNEKNYLMKLDEKNESMQMLESENNNMKFFNSPLTQTNLNLKKYENLENEDFLDQNYLNYENIYLNEGKIKSNLDKEIFGNANNELDINREKMYDNNLNSNASHNQKFITPNNQIFYAPNNQIMSTPNSQIFPTSNNKMPYSQNNQIFSSSNNQNSYSQNLPVFSSTSTFYPPLAESIIPNENHFVSEKNEYKLKRLQEKIEEKLRDEYEMKIKTKEIEIEKKTKNEFEEAMNILKRELEKNLDEEKRKMEDDLQKKWQEKYEDLIIDCKSKLRDDKEQKLAMNMYQKLRPNVEKEIYKNEYSKVEEKIKRELEGKINQEIMSKKTEEIERVKRKLEYFTKVKLEEMENNLKNKCKEEIENEMKKEIEKKEKEMKTNYLRKFENFKNNLEKQLKDEYESKKKELSKEVSEIKSKVYRQKCAEKLKLNKINSMKKTLIEKEKQHFENAGKLEKALQVQSTRGLNKSMNNGSNHNLTKSRSKIISSEDYYLEDADSINEQVIAKPVTSENISTAANNLHKLNNKELTKMENNFGTINLEKLNIVSNKAEDYPNQVNDSKKFTKVSTQSPDFVRDRKNTLSSLNFSHSNNVENNFNSINFQNMNTQNSFNINSATNQIPQSHTNGTQSVNIFELNKKFKSFTPLTLNSSDIISPQNNKKEVSLIIKDDYLNNSNNNLKDNLNNMIIKNSKLNVKHREERKSPSNSPKKIIERPIRNEFNQETKESNFNSKYLLNNKELNSSSVNIGSNFNTNLFTVSSPTNGNMSPRLNFSNSNCYTNGNVNSNINNNNNIANNTYANVHTNANLPSNVVYYDPNENLMHKHPIIANCHTLKINGKIPISLIDFGKFLVKYIENEENYRILFERESKKIKMQIKKIFEQSNLSDHCLLDYLIELWDKIETTFYNRYKILQELSKRYYKETEYLTEYFQKSDDIFKIIKNREKLKLKLQVKANKNSLTPEDKEKFKQFTLEISRKLKVFKQKSDMDIIWKGLFYEWIVNYENWFYENKK